MKFFTSFLCLFLFTFGHIKAQFFEKIFVEVPIYSYRTVGGAHSYSESTMRSEFLSRLNVGYKVSDKWTVFLGYHRLIGRVGYSGGFSAENTQQTGNGWQTGLEYIPNANKKIHLSYLLRAFSEQSVIVGENFVDYPQTDKLIYNHDRQYVGVGMNLRFNWRISKILKLYVEGGFRHGYLSISPDESLNNNRGNLINYNKWSFTVDYLNAIGFRISI